MTLKVREQELAYLKLLIGDEVYVGMPLTIDGTEKSETYTYKKIKEAYNKSHEIRKFEIELYWKRAAYFWAFITVVFGVIITLLSSKDPIKNESIIIQAISVIGIISCLSFTLANIASKYWQKNWEHNVWMLEYYVSGDLYKLLNSKDELYFSVSSINLSFSIALLIFSVVSYGYLSFHVYTTNYTIFIAGLLINLFIFGYSTRFPSVSNSNIKFSKNNFNSIE